MAKRVLVLDDGGIALDGAPSEIFEKEDILRGMGLDVPQCTSLVHRLREAGIELCGDASTPEAAADLIANALVGGAANG